MGGQLRKGVERMFASLMARFGAWIVGIGGALLGILAIFASAKRTGKAEGEKVAAEQIAKDREAIAANEVRKEHVAAEANAKAIERAGDEISDVNRMSNDAVNRELRDKWTRD